MEDLGKGIKAGKVAEPTGTKVAMIKQDILAKYPESLYLPIWLVKTNDTTYRRFNYDIDIKSKFDFGLVNLASLIKDTIKPSLSSKVQRRTDIVVTIEESKFGEKGKSEIAEMEDGIDLPYLSRRIFDVVDNPFSAREYANCAMKILETEIEIANLKSNFGFIVNEIATAYDKSKRDQEKSIFESLANDHRIILALSEDKKLGFKIPDKETIPISQYPNLYNSYLFDDLDVTTLNGLEEQIAKTIDEKENVIWWFRNKPNKNWYGVKGWRKGNIYPDFISAKKGTDGKLDLVYVIESKGEHLGGSEDTIYKKSVFKAINETNKQIISNNISLVKFKVNDKFHFEVVDQEEVVARIGLLFA
ncbi:hypothetical protein COT49_03020 [candidate division WWE3 bacterium CG08_land_8_20_14_0_20_40_13]|uniref:Uncharacterized protein n=1 Tax=candidate division WWE3 bacterium CG08_land_8_20_14_0_20_40_13 TaxID=1975084 RepID=A0A2H0XD95_UNCKA|nr:MAG: hypothetical protein COT49_03020 [candidate division WWE3 bacterium CG08_land_8_20_14_0_20_40_13]